MFNAPAFIIFQDALKRDIEELTKGKEEMLKKFAEEGGRGDAYEYLKEYDLKIKSDEVLVDILQKWFDQRFHTDEWTMNE